ncbi:hypothetical protein [Legionella yabuuchiae]|uniref:hypothetical protein n=1 Tax=Legionella yabuuchiae TaxID=376727 RepID=UPI001054B0D8|nr:hypothetical protein [Legionella yabuuchiae]
MREVAQQFMAVAIKWLKEEFFTNPALYHPDFASGLRGLLRSGPEDALTLFLKDHGQGSQIDTFLNECALDQSKPELIPVLAQAIEKTPQLADRISAATVRTLIAQKKYELVYSCVKHCSRLTAHLIPFLKQQDLMAFKEKKQLECLELLLNQYKQWLNIPLEAKKRIQKELTFANLITLLTSPDSSILRWCVFRTGYLLKQWVETIKKDDGEWTQAIAALKETAKRFPSLFSLSLDAFQLLLDCLKHDEEFKTGFKEQMELQSVSPDLFNRYFEIIYNREDEYLLWISFFPEQLHQEKVLHRAVSAVQYNFRLLRDSDYIWGLVAKHLPLFLTLANRHAPLKELLTKQMLDRKNAMMTALRDTCLSPETHARFQKESQDLQQLHRLICSSPELSTGWEQVFPEIGQAELLQTARNSSRRSRGAVTQFGLWSSPASEASRAEELPAKRRHTLTGESGSAANETQISNPKRI